MHIGCLMIHGFTGSPYEIEPLTTYLKEKTAWDIRVPILPGHGAEENLEEATYEDWLYSCEEVLQDLLEVNEYVYVIGFSMGGMIAAYLTAIYPVDKVVLLAPAGKVFSLRQLTIDFGEVIADRFRGTLHENQLYTHYKSKVQTSSMKANIEFLRLVKYTRTYLKSITTPLFMAHGKLDSIVPVNTLHYLHKEIPSKEKEVVIFERSRHLICLGQDQHILNEMVLQFLTQPSELHYYLN